MVDSTNMTFQVAGQSHKSREVNLKGNFSRHTTVLHSWTSPVNIFISDLDINIKAMFITLTNLQFIKLRVKDQRFHYAGQVVTKECEMCSFLLSISKGQFYHDKI